MTEAFIKQWYSRIPEMERDLPLIYYKGKVYSPKDVYEEVVEKHSELGEELQNMLERMASPHTVSYEDLKSIKIAAEERIKKLLDYLPKDFSIVALSGEIIGKDQILERLRNAAIEFEMRKILKLIKGDNYEDTFP